MTYLFSVVHEYSYRIKRLLLPFSKSVFTYMCCLKSHCIVWWA